ncbi:acetoin dehydrogenase e3 component, putative [Trypanosoma brucei gambiense DAL972]|uniref:Dihydrolipoamide dehydrogenase, point mutation n=1 Tax=Trypanosoma brucei gambiense (strain MHOM/CI/86/DAL972) TaxID=679716 RepID=C9ZWN2_TRYB9|nr:acetoin dehydrogenase e3 component, putative [Trypanosoma brucei gambiense DAL972]CBH13821.1 acetoin dehydrogenase e3 component, putative [Trypanosoma brucei gambiense DAL972]|eukprot:XP_011776097.1 acetoin dehydrogenase e3 component, putative [Trypanosoma brucei gambiense DAL972]
MLRHTRFSFTHQRPHLVHWQSLGKTHFDVCVIGAGPAGIAAALRAVDYNKRVCLVEAKRIGGCDLWNGTLQSKTLWEMSNFLGRARGSSAERVYGTTISNFMELDDERMLQTLQEVSETREKQVLSALSASNVALLYGRAAFASPHELEVSSREAKEYRTVTADYFIIATGSAPVTQPHVPVDHKNVVTSDDLMTLPLPKSMVVVGGGALGSEFATTYGRLGKTKVFLLDKKERIMPKEDDDVAATIQKGMEKHGVEVHQDCLLYSLQSLTKSESDGQETPNDGTSGNGVRYTIMHRKTHELQTYEVERALIVTGRRPNYFGLGLRNTNCEVRDGVLVLDEFGRCVNQKHIYAVGDATGRDRSVSMGEAKGRLAVDHIYSPHITEPLHPDHSRIVFLDTAVASVGKNEKQCREKNVSYVVAKYGFELCSRNVAASNTEGFVKILASNDSKKTLLGVHVVGWSGSTIVEFATAAIQRKQSAYELSEMLTAYPSVSQAFLECLRVILGTSMLKPGTFPGLVCNTWTPSDCERGRGYCSLGNAQGGGKQ